MSESACRAWFVTGTDTGIGKTFASCVLIHAAKAKGFTALGMKPVASGAEIIDGKPINEDAARLLAAGSFDPGLERVNPYCLQLPASPHLAAQEENIQIDPARIRQSFDELSERCDRLYIEGAGGFLAPLGEEIDASRIARELGCPLILVVGMRLGCINHAQLTAKAILASNLRLDGWIANCLYPDTPYLSDNIKFLCHCLDAPLLGVLPYAPNAAPDALAHLVTLPCQPIPDTVRSSFMNTENVAEPKIAATDQENLSEDSAAPEAAQQEASGEERPKTDTPSKEAPSEEPPKTDADSEEASDEELPEADADSEETPDEEIPETDADSEETSDEELPEADADSEETPDEEIPETDADSEETPDEELSEVDTDNEETSDEELPEADADSEETPDEEIPEADADSEETPDEEIPEADADSEEASDEEIPVLSPDDAPKALATDSAFPEPDSPVKKDDRPFIVLMFAAVFAIVAFITHATKDDAPASKAPRSEEIGLIEAAPTEPDAAESSPTGEQIESAQLKLLETEALNDYKTAREHYQRGDYAISLTWHQKSRSGFEQLMAYYDQFPNSTQRIAARKNLAAIYSALGDVYRSQKKYPDALDMFKKALSIYEKTPVDKNLDAATTYNNIAEIHRLQGDYMSAQSGYLKAYRILRLAVGDNHPTARAVRLSLARAHDKLDNATPFGQWLEEHLR